MEGDATYEARRQILSEQREIALEKLERVQEGLDRLDYKIARYDELIAGRGAGAETCPNQEQHSLHNVLGPSPFARFCAAGKRAVLQAATSNRADPLAYKRTRRQQ